MKKNNNKKTANMKWIFIFIPIIVLAIIIGINYKALDNYSATDDNSVVEEQNPKKEFINEVMKEAIKNPAQIKEVLDSISITTENAQNENISDGVKISSIDIEQNKNSSNGGASSSSGNASNETKAAAIEDLKENYEDYELISSDAVNVEGDKYHVIAKVKNRNTGEVKNIELETELSETMKDLLIDNNGN